MGTEKDFLNAMLDKEIKKARKPMWRKNIEGALLLSLYFIILPSFTIFLIYTKHYFLAIIPLIPAILGIGVAIGGRKFTLWLMSGVLKLKK